MRKTLFILLFSIFFAYPLIINEIMQNPASVNDSGGEWFEILNISEDEIFFEGNLILRDGLGRGIR